MNPIKKCIDELKQEKPNIPYLLGILETYYEMQKPVGGIGLGQAFKPATPIMPAVDAIGKEFTPPKYEDNEQTTIPPHLQPGTLGNIR